MANERGDWFMKESLFLALVLDVLQWADESSELTYSPHALWHAVCDKLGTGFYTVIPKDSSWADCDKVKTLYDIKVEDMYMRLRAKYITEFDANNKYELDGQMTIDDLGKDDEE